MADHDFVAGDIGITLRLTFKDESAVVVDCSSSTVWLVWTDGKGVTHEEEMTDHDAVNGEMEYTFVDGDDFVPGSMTIEGRIDDGAGVIRTNLDSTTYSVRARTKDL